jgi:hypothetical protein
MPEELKQAILALIETQPLAAVVAALASAEAMIATHSLVRPVSNAPKTVPIQRAS